MLARGTTVFGMYADFGTLRTSVKSLKRWDSATTSRFYSRSMLF